jgi:hypothetical protein
MHGVVKEGQWKGGKFIGDTLNNPTEGKQKKRLADDNIGVETHVYEGQLQTTPLKCQDRDNDDEDFVSESAVKPSGLEQRFDDESDSKVLVCLRPQKRVKF